METRKTSHQLPQADPGFTLPWHGHTLGHGHMGMGMGVGMGHGHPHGQWAWGNGIPNGHMGMGDGELNVDATVKLC